MRSSGYLATLFAVLFTGHSNLTFASTCENLQKEEKLYTFTSDDTTSCFNVALPNVDSLSVTLISFNEVEANFRHKKNLTSMC